MDFLGGCFLSFLSDILGMWFLRIFLADGLADFLSVCWFFLVVFISFSWSIILSDFHDG